MTEEDYFGSSSSDEESYTFSHDSRNKQKYVSSGHSKKSPGNRNAPLHHCKSCYPSEDDERTMFSPRDKFHVYKSISPTYEQENLCDTETVWDSSLDEIWKQPTPQRKTRQKLLKEKEAAITIQSAWRGYQVRKELDTLDEAATRIQAAFRGYRTRKKWPFLQCESGSSPAQKLKRKMRGQSESRSFQELLNYFEQFGLSPGSQNIFLPSGQQRSYPKNVVDYIGLQPQVALLERPQRQMFTSGALVSPMSRPHEAASTIQAAWRGQQIKQRGSPTMLLGEKCLKNSYCSNYRIEEIYRKHTTPEHTLEEHEIRGIIAKSSTLSFRNVPRVRNINIYTIVKGMPVSPKPCISIRVSSPNAVVQGYQKDMSGGVHGLYTIKNHYCQRPSQILIHVNLQKEKGLKSCP